VQRPRDGFGVLATGLVVVRQDRDAAAGEVLGKPRPPLAGPHRVAGRDQAQFAEAIDVLLALGDPDRLGFGLGIEERVEVVGHDADAVEVVDVAALPVRPSLDELFAIDVLLADDLEEQRARLVDVVVDRRDVGAAPPILYPRAEIVGEKVLELQAYGGEHVGGLAPGVALHQDLAVAAVRDMQAGVSVAVCVRRTGAAGHDARAVRLDPVRP
jgi:hypothetical protein